MVRWSHVDIELGLHSWLQWAGFACIIDIDDVEYAKAIGLPIQWDTFIVNTPSTQRVAG